METPNEPLLLSKRDAAKLLCACEATLDRMVKKGELPRVMIGRVVRFARQDLIAWIDSQKRLNAPATS